MALSPAAEPQRSSLSGFGPTEATPGEHSETALQAAAPLAGDRLVPASLAFVFFAAIELAFVFGLLVLTKLTPTQILTIAAQATGISVAGFFSRNVIIVVGRLMSSGPGNR